MCWKKKKQKRESYKKEPSLRQPTPQRQLGCDVACHADNAPEARAPNDQQAASARRNVENATRDSREKEKKPVKKKNTVNSENPREERSPCCPTQHSNTWKDAVSCSEGLILQQTQATNGPRKDESCTSGESTLVGIPAEMPFFQNEDDSKSELLVLEDTQESKEQIGKDLCSAQHFSSGDTLEGIARVMPDFQDD